jgi:multicomponent Na+:H+ antiporter subunit E
VRSLLGRNAVLLALWLALWGEVSVGNVATGVAMCALLWWLFPASGASHRFRPLGFLRFVGHVLWSLVTSSLAVVLAVVLRTPERIATSVITVPLVSSSPLVATLVANAISVTPGTLTLDVRCAPGTPSELDVHVLGSTDAASFRASIRQLEQRVLRAFEPAEPVVSVAEPGAVEGTR